MENKVSSEVSGNGFFAYVASLIFTDLMTQGFFLSIIFYITIFVRLRKKEKRLKLTAEQEEKLIEKWKPEPLVPEVPQDHPRLVAKFAEGKMDKYITRNGAKYFNFATFNFLNFVGNERIENIAKITIQKYGVGSCGPRNFYGTVDVHLNLERQLANFLGCEEVVLYSYGFATISSAIPSYAKQGDVIFADKAVNFAIQKGLEASKSRIEWFEHNDMVHLEKLLKKQTERDLMNPKVAAKTRRFLVVEGLYANTGDLCPLPQIMNLKWKYKVRVFIDEAYSIGIVGRTGRGVTEYYNIDITDVDLITGSLEYCFASTGGFCAGRSFVVSHQRLSGLGYCFSASLPPLLATAAGEALQLIIEKPCRLTRLRLNCEYIHLALIKIFKGTQFEIGGWQYSPIQFIYCKNKSVDEDLLLDNIVDKMKEKSFIITRARYLEKQERFDVRQCIRVAIQSDFNQEELEKFVSAMQEVVSNYAS
ncbi:unnamed protein product [Dracunculus medinensis]|uniref:Serine palmitoyltransferase 1 n=1 Tax=Dracunculus medinensis TaxID=318479 RepID=A0A158Q4E5_DRAME|nr:unnamed protein product [Dracunculus medinensis]